MEAEAKPKPKGCLGSSRRNHLYFAFLTIALQIVMSVMYGLYLRSPPEYINPAAALLASLLALLVVAGFGLYFSYATHLVWSSLGFNLLLTALALQLYPLVNAFWSKAAIFSSPLAPDSFATTDYHLFLGNLASYEGKQNTITGALRCAFALVVAYTAVIGRIGSLECLFLAVFGTVGYELNRQVIVGLGQDFFGTYSIFSFGGYAGLMMGIILALREKKNVGAMNYAEKLQGCHQSALHSLFGALLIFALLPLLAYEGDNSNKFFLFSLTNGPLSVLLSMASAVVVSIGCGLFYRGSFRVKDLMNAVISGGVISGTASYYITTPVLALICGAVGAIFQYTLDNGAEKRLYQRFGHFTTYSFSLFGIQGLLGAIFAAGYSNRVSNSQDNGFVYSTDPNHAMQFGIYFISAGIGLATGLVVGLLSYAVSQYNTSEQMFHDRTEWQPDDGIRYPPPKLPEPLAKKITSKKEDQHPINPVQPTPPLVSIEEPIEPEFGSEQFDDFFFADMLLVPLD